MSIAQGIHGSGGRGYDWRDLAVVRDILSHTTPRAALTVEDIHLATGVLGRTVRQIVSDIDGLDFLLGGTDGYFVSEYQEDAAPLTHALQSQVDTMRFRLDRRTGFAPRLPRRQDSLF